MTSHSTTDMSPRMMLNRVVVQDIRNPFCRHRSPSQASDETRARNGGISSRSILFRLSPWAPTRNVQPTN